MNLPKYTPETSMIMLQDGGELAENSLSGLPKEMWNDFQTEFLSPA
jgi:hypothetical protein